MGFGELGAVTILGKGVPKEVALDGVNTAIQAADELGVFDEI